MSAIEDAQGFDSYILETPVQDLHSQLALNLRRKMLIALAKQDFHHENPNRKAKVYEKYKQFIIPV